MRSVWQDLRYGLRGLRNNLSFTALAALALALGSGAATTIFSAIQNVLLDPFPYTNAERVVSIMIHDVTNSRPGGRTDVQDREVTSNPSSQRRLGHGPGAAFLLLGASK
jgi:hypothetical protein